jgi:hypothetical protein
MHLEAHGLLPVMNKDKGYMVGDENAFMNGSALVPIHNHARGINTIVLWGDFTSLPPLSFRFPPIEFTTHQMANTQEGWRIKIKQKSDRSRPIVTLMNNANFGLRLRIQAGYYPSVAAVFREVQRQYMIERSEHSNINMVPKTRIVTETVVRLVDRFVPIRQTITDAMRQETVETYRRLGNWRPGKPSLHNVISLEEFIEKLDKLPQKNPISAEEWEAKVAKML